MARRVIFNGVKGLANKHDPTRVIPIEDDGLVGLAEAWNVMIDDTGAAFTRPPLESIDVGEWHSLFSCGDYAVGVRDGFLMVIEEDGTVVVIDGPGYNHRLSWVEVNGEFYFTSLSRQGIVSNKVFRPFDSMTVGHHDYGDYAPAPLGQHIAFHLGRVWIAVDNAVFFSEPLGFNLFDFGKSSILFPHDIFWMKSAGEGVYIATQKTLFYIAGDSPERFEMKAVLREDQKMSGVCPEILDLSGYSPEGSLKKLGDGVLFCCAKGLYLGTGDGKVKCLSESLIFPQTGEAGAVAVDDTHIYFCLGL